MCTIFLRFSSGWRRVRRLAKSKRLKLNLFSDRQYHRRSRPMPHGGCLYTFGTDLCVRYQQVTPAEAEEFINNRFK